MGIGVLGLAIGDDNVRHPCLATISKSPAIRPVICRCCAAIFCWWQGCADRHCCPHCHYGHCPPSPIKKLIVESSLSSPLGSTLSSSLPPCPRKPTDRRSGGQRQGRCLGPNCIGVVAASLPGVEGRVELAMRRIVIMVFVGLAANTVFLQNSQKSTKIKN